MTDLTAPILLNIDCREGLAGLAGGTVMPPEPVEPGLFGEEVEPQ